LKNAIFLMRNLADFCCQDKYSEGLEFCLSLRLNDFSISYWLANCFLLR
jgi:hypothetical protein